MGVEFRYAALRVKLAMLQVRPHARTASRTSTLRFTAQISDRGRAAAAARVVLEAVVPGQRVVLLQLRAVPGQSGRYAANTGRLSSTGAALLFLRTTVRGEGPTAEQEAA